MQKLAVRFGMDFEDLKAQWRPRIKELLPDLLELCVGGDDASESDAEKANTGAQEEEEEEVDLRPSRKRTTSKRNAVVDASDEEEEGSGANDSDASEGEAASPDEEEEENDVAPAKKRRSAVRIAAASDKATCSCDGGRMLTANAYHACSRTAVTQERGMLRHLQKRPGQSSSKTRRG
jgi:hypothetical protein